MSDSREIAQHQAGGALAAQTQASNILMMVIDAARDPTIDAAKVKTMADLAMQVQDREQQSEFNRALNAAIMEMPTITKAGAIVITKDGNSRIQGRYAKFEDIDRVVRPILQRHNLAIRFEIDSDSGLVTVRPIISHANGFVERGGAMKVPMETSGSKNNVQAAGSSVAYAKRYGLCAALNIITEGVDDDGTGRGQVTLPHEREQTVLDGALVAFEDGAYQAFFNAQSPKDRAYLIQSGKHVEYGGTVALVGAPTATGKPPREVVATGEQPRQPEQPSAAKGKQTAEEWVEQFEGWVAQCSDRPALEKLETKFKDALIRLRRDNISLGRRADEAVRDRRIDIDAADDEGGPADSQRGEGGTLFGED